MLKPMISGPNTRKLSGSNIPFFVWLRAVGGRRLQVSFHKAFLTALWLRAWAVYVSHHPGLANRPVRTAILVFAGFTVFMIVRFYGDGIAAEQARRRVMAAPAALVRMTGQDIQRILGYPRLFRSEPPAQLWQYQAEDCVLDLFLYDGKRKDHRDAVVTHYQLRARDQDNIETDLKDEAVYGCIAELLSRR